MGHKGGSPALTLASAWYCIRRLSLQSFERVYTRIECYESPGVLIVNEGRNCVSSWCTYIPCPRC
jgi:hypothetical protein